MSMFFKNSPNVLFRHKNVLFDKLLGKKKHFCVYKNVFLWKLGGPNVTKMFSSTNRWEKIFLCLQKCFPMETWWPEKVSGAWKEIGPAGNPCHTFIMIEV